MPRPRSDIRERLIRAARKQFLLRGVDGASLRAIAAEAGTNIGMVYYYFPAKDDLFSAIVDEVYDALLHGLEADFRAAPDVPAQLRALFARVAGLQPNELEVARLVVREALTSSERLKRITSRFLGGHIPMLLQVVGNGISDGTLAPRHPLVLMMAILATAGPAQVLGRRVAAQMAIPGVPSPEQLQSALFEVLWNGIAGPSGKSGQR